MSEFVTALLFGGGVILVFSFTQFERPTYEPSRELTRLVGFLLPSDLRRPRVFYPAYGFYAGLLLLIYVVMCVFLTVPMLEALGFVFETAPESRQSPLVPLVISLAMVGIAPSLPLLQRLEERIRYAAHRLSGIPAQLLHGCRILNARWLGLPEGGPGYLIPAGDWARLGRYLTHGRPMVHDPDDLARDLVKIVAYRAWFVEQNLVVPPRTPTTRIRHNEAELATRIDQLLLGLDALTSAQMQAGDGGPRIDSGPRELWQRYKDEANDLAADVCAMIVLYVEHGLLARDDGATSPEAGAAWEALETFVEGSGGWAEEGAVVGALWTRATATVVGVAALWGGVLGNLESAAWMMPPLAAATTALSAFLIYSLAIYAALALHDRAVQARRWRNLVTDDWTAWIGPALGPFLIAALAAVVCTVAMNLYWTIASYGLAAVEAKFWQALWAALAFEGPRALLGPILAMGLIGLVDVWRTGRDARRRLGDAPEPEARAALARVLSRRHLTVLGLTVATMALWAAISRGWSIQYGLAWQCGGDTACLAAIPSLAQIALHGPPPELALKGPPLALAALRAGLIGLAVLLVCRRTLERSLSALDEPRPAPGPLTAPAE